MNLFPSFAKYFVRLYSPVFCLWVYMIHGDVNVDEWCQELWQSVNQSLICLLHNKLCKTTIVYLIIKDFTKKFMCE